MSAAGSEERFIEVDGNRPHIAVDGRAGGCWRISARGHGRATVEHPAESVHDPAADVVAVWGALGIDRSHVLGLSLGGMTGIGIALEHPSGLRGR
jgi:pimeloyl-ACP methyl ester carboxylesterase